MDSSGDGKVGRNLHFEGENNPDEMQQYNEKINSLKKYIPFLEKLIGVIDPHSSKVLSNYLAAVKNLQSMITNPKSNRVKWDTLQKTETFLKKLYDRRHHQSENSAAQDIVNFLDSLRHPPSTDTYHSPSRPRTQDHHAMTSDNTPHSWNPSIRDRTTTISSRAKTTYLGDPHEPTTSYSNQRVFGGNFSRSPRSTSTSTDSWRDRYQWEQQQQQQQQRNNQNDRYNSWNDVNSHGQIWDGSPRHGFRQDNFRNWDANRANPDYDANSRVSDFDPFKMSPRYSSPNVVRHQSPNLMRSPESRTRDPRLLYGRVNPSSMNIRSAVPPSVYVPSSRRLSDEIETPRSPSPEPDVPVIPPKIIMDSSPNLNLSTTSTTGSEALRCDDEGPGVQEEKQVFSCEFCSYIGKKIIPHHVNRHPGKEVPIKLSKSGLDEALREFDDEKRRESEENEVEITENVDVGKNLSEMVSEDLSWIPERSIFLRPIDCKICGYTTVVKTNLIQHLISHRNPDKNMSTMPSIALFNCRFCESTMSNCQEFRDHISTHTGEFQYTCGYCPFRGFSSKSVRTHINCEHVGKTAFVKRERDNGRLGEKILGFVCSVCRFVQMSEEMVTAHVRGHGEVGAKVLCVSMSKMAKKEKKERVDGGEGDKKSEGVVEVKGVEEARQESAVSEKEVFRDDDDEEMMAEEAIFQMATQAYVDSDNENEESDLSTIPTQKYVDSEDENEESDLSTIPTQKYVDSEDENLLPTQKYVDESAIATQKYVDSDENDNENLGPTQKYIDSDENDVDLLAATQKYVDSDVENNDVEKDVDESSSPRLQIATPEIESEDDKTTTPKPDDDNLPPTQPYVDDDEDDNETDTDDDESDNESDNSSGDGTNSPPHLEPENDNSLLDEDENSNLSMLSENGGQLPPSIAETISRLQATLKKGVKRSSLPPPVLEPIDPKTTKPRDETSTIPLASTTTSVAFKCGAKSCGFFSGDENVFLHHLEASHTPREAPCTECGGCFAQWKLLLAHLKSECEANDKLPQFACGFEDCDYATSNEMLFFAHTRRTHKKEMQLPCCFCRNSFTLVTSLVRHLKEGCRAAKSMKSEKKVREVVDKKVVDEEEGVGKEVEDCGKKVEEGVDEREENLSLKVVYQCPVSSCDHKSLERNVFRSHVVKLHVDVELVCRVCERKLDDVDDAICHMESDHGDEEVVVKAVKRRMSDVDESFRKKVALDVDVGEKEKEKEKEVSTPILRTVNELSSSLDVDLDENLALPLENIRQRDPAVESLAVKTLSAMLDVDELKHLFKCMAPACRFATSTRDAFVLHLSETSCGSRNLCAYCMQELPGVVALVDHVVKHHGHCTFQCKYCFYRAITDEYVTLHQQKRHSTMSTGSLVCERNPDSVDPVNEPVDGEFVIPYRCAIDGCSCEVADPEEFRQHNLKEHSSTSLFPCHHCGVTCLSTERLLVHYKVHGCNDYQCGFCLHGAETDEEILFHLCSIHPNRRGRLIVRSVSNNKLLESAKYQVKSEVLKPTIDLGSLKMEITRSTIGAPNKTPATPIKDTDLKVGHDLFQCGYPPCSFSASTAEMLREHMVTCTSSCLMTSAKCPHCGRQWRTLTVFLEHVVTQHGGRRFICGRCPFRGPTVEFVQGHMKLQHGVPSDQTKSELKDPGSDPEVGEYVVQEVTVVTPVKAAKSEGKSTDRRTMVTRKGTTFGVEDMERLPMQCIFPREICCAVCGYATKVRSNLIRHLQMHRRQDGDSSTLSVDVKVKEEKGFRHSSKSTNKGRGSDVTKVEEKVKNEDGDSTTGIAGILCPQFVANTSLYRCAVEGCDYLALDTTMYKCHVTTLHPDVGAFPCPHCGERTTSLDKLLIHFRLHGPRLYKCNKCNYSSYRHHQIETHHNTAHGNRFLPVITVREQVKDEESSVEVVKPVSKKEGKFLTPTTDVTTTSSSSSTMSKSEPDSRHVWCCAICTHPGPTKSIIKNHLQTCHGVRSEFKCGVCSCVSNAFESVRLHFVSRHPDAEVKIMPLIVKVKDYDPNNLFVTAPKESTSTSSSGGGARVSTSSSTVGEVPPASMPVTRRASLTAAAAASRVDEGVEVAAKNDGGSSKDGVVAVTDVGEKTVSKLSEGRVKGKAAKEAVVENAKLSSKDVGDGGSAAAGKVMFVCPVCHEYRTKFRGDMRIHIYRELHYRRVQCLKCNALFVSEKEAKHHSYKTHRGQALSLQKNEIPERENWVKEQLDGQVLAWGSVPRSTSKMPKLGNVETGKGQNKNSSDVKSEIVEQNETSNVEGVKDVEKTVESVRGDVSPTGSSTLTDDNADAKVVVGGNEASRQFRYYCTQCSYQCEGTTDLRKHIFRHLKFKPFQCTHCLLRFSEKQQIRNHHNLFHPDNEFVCERQPNMEPERFVDELLHQQRMEWKDKKKSGSPVIKMTKTAAQITVAKMAAESVTTVTTESGSVQKVYACRHDGCNFTCDQLKGLKVHLMAHLRQARFHCGYCSVTGSSQYQVRRHCLSIHAGKKVLVLAIKSETSTSTPASTPSTTLTSQQNVDESGNQTSTSSMMTSMQRCATSTTTTTTTTTTRGVRLHKCPYCPYSHTLPKMISRHLMRHYVEKPFQCGHCKRTGIEKFDILYHCRKVHPDLEPKVINTPLPTNPEIRPILRRGHGGHSIANEDVDGWSPQEENASSNNNNNNSSNNNNEGEQIDLLPLEVQVTELGVDKEPSSPGSTASVTTRRIYECNSCNSRFNSKDEVRNHLVADHQDHGSSFRVVVTAVKKSTVVVEEASSSLLTTHTSSTGHEATRTSLLKCIYCDLASDSLKLLRKHCHESHTGSEVRLRKMAADWEANGETMLRCGYCPFAASQMALLWDHHRLEHVGKAVKFRIAARKGALPALSTVGRKAKNTAGLMGCHVLWCSYCNDPCESIEQMVRHWKMFHGHLELKYKTQSGVEGIISKELTDGALQGESEHAQSSTSVSSDEKVGEGSGVTVTIYGCAQCKYESDKYDMVRQHLFRHLQRFACPACRKLYPFEYELKKHVEVHHQGLVLESVKNPQYDDQEKEELIRNIRVRHVNKSTDGNEDESGVSKLNKVSRQVARKSLRGMTITPTVSRVRLSAKKSTSSKPKSSNLLLRATLEENLPAVQQRQQEIIAELTSTCRLSDSPPPSKKIRVDDRRVSLSYRDLYFLSQIQPVVAIETLSDEFE